MKKEWNNIFDGGMCYEEFLFLSVNPDWIQERFLFFSSNNNNGKTKANFTCHLPLKEFHANSNPNPNNNSVGYEMESCPSL